MSTRSQRVEAALVEAMTARDLAMQGNVGAAWDIGLLVAENERLRRRMELAEYRSYERPTPEEYSRVCDEVRAALVPLLDP